MNTFGIPRTALEVFNTLPEGAWCEVIDNTLYFPPSRTTTYQDVLGNIILGIYNRIAEFGEVLIGPCDVYLDGGESVVQPDILFVKAERTSIIEKKGIIGSPDFVIEILSTNMKLDKETKLNLYQRNAIPEYFIIDPETKNVWHYLLVNNVYELQSGVIRGN